jgi:hypothetical protein
MPPHVGVEIVVDMIVELWGETMTFLIEDLMIQSIRFCRDKLGNPSGSKTKL